MKFLVLGCNGMAGHMISLYLNESGHDVLGLDTKKSKYVRSIVGNAFDSKTIKEVIEQGKFDSIINCIGVLNQYAEQNKATAAYLNGYFPHFLAETTYSMETQVIHMSTDCVFSGKKGGYSENDFLDGGAFYDRTKAVGEIIDEKNVTLRNSIVGPDLNKNGIGLLNWFMQQNNNVNGYTKSIWTGQTTLQLAKTMETVAKNKAYGLFNAVPNKAISKYDLLQLFSKYLRKNLITIVPTEGASLNKSLKRMNYNFEFSVPDYEIMISELSKWIMKHRTMYPHYFKEQERI